MHTSLLLIVAYLIWDHYFCVCAPTWIWASRGLESPCSPYNSKAYPAAAKSLQSCPTLRDPIKGSPPGSPVPGILPGASVRNSAHGKGHEEGGLAYAKAWSSLRKPPVPKHLTPKPESVLCSRLHLWLYGGLSPITVSLREGVNMQLQGNKNSWAWQECFSFRTPLKVI